jgi:hypothetical protein
MKKPKKLKKPNLKKVSSSAKLARDKLLRRKAPEEKMNEAISNVPRITNETVTEHREEVLKGARKFIYPLQHSKYSIVKISISLLAVVIIAFFAYCLVGLYKLQVTNGFIYGVTKVVPFPVAKAGTSWVSYESYLFELRRNMHYYATQQKTDFNSQSGKDQLALLKKQALNQVIQDAYVKQLAEKNGVSVSSTQVNNQLALLRKENRLGNSDRVFKDVLKEFWGWSEGDFKQELRQQLLQQAVAVKLDTATQNRAQSALAQIKGGADFATVATAQSDDNSTKAAGGQYAQPISASDRDIAPALTDALFRLNPNQVSDIVNAGYTLEILKVTEKTNNTVRASHIQFTIQPINIYTKPLEIQNPPKKFIKV